MNVTSGETIHIFKNWISNISKQLLLLSCILIISPNFLSPKNGRILRKTWPGPHWRRETLPVHQAVWLEHKKRHLVVLLTVNARRRRKHQTLGDRRWRWRWNPAGEFRVSFPMGFFSSVNEGNKKGQWINWKTSPKPGVCCFLWDEEGGKFGGVFSILNDLMWGSD